MNKPTILVTGASGMIGSSVVQGLLHNGYAVVGLDRVPAIVTESGYTHCVVDLADVGAIDSVFEQYTVSRVIHLAALAHTAGEKDLSWDRYYAVNVACSKNIFIAAGKRNIPILYISTVDVYGFSKGMIAQNTQPEPVTYYGKSKYLAEQELRSVCAAYAVPYTIFRFAPVYTDEVKRDIQKRYYLKYPNIAYMIGKGIGYEVLNICNAVISIVTWCGGDPDCSVKHIKDEKLLNTAECIRAEKAAGRAKFVLHFPRWLVFAGYKAVKFLIGKNKYTYLLHKAVCPFRTES